jgi:putative transposase
MTQFIDTHKHESGFEPICRTLQVAPSSYSAAKARPLSDRSISDAARTIEVSEGTGSTTASTAPGRSTPNCGGRVIRRPAAPSNDSFEPPGCRVCTSGGGENDGSRSSRRPAREPRAVGVHRDRPRPALGRRHHLHPYVLRLVYAAFRTDVFSRRIVGWQLSKNMHTDLVLDALEMGIWTPQREGHDLSQLVHHSDRGVQ